MENIPVIKLGLVAVSRDCFPIVLSEKRRAAIAEKCGQKDLNFVEIKTTVENEKDMLKAVAELKEGGPAVAELTAAGMARKLVDDHNDLCVSLNDFLGQVIPAALSGVEVESLIADDRTAKAKGKAKRKGIRRKGKAACL
mgnify:CR=1 FL=1